MDNHAKVLQYLVSVEKLGQEILADKREIVSLEKQRNKNREVLREIAKSSETKCWVTVGSVLVKHSLETTIVLLKEDQKQLNTDINKLISDVKVKINKLRDLEMLPAATGSLLVPMSQKEKEGLASAGLFSK